MAAPQVTILILNWNGRNWLEQFLPSVLATRGVDYAVWVVDNASTDDSVPFLRERYADQVHVVQLDQNYGFAEGNNRGLALVESPYVVLLNSDVEVDPDWLTPCIKRLEADPKLAALQPKIRAYHHRNHFEYAGGAGGWIDRLGYPFCRGRVLNHTEEDHGQYDDFQYTFWASGACLVFRKAVTDRIGLFDARFFAHMEEIDFCWRAQNAGWRIGVEPRGVVYHVGGGTLGYESPRKVYLNVRNSLFCLVKNLPVFQLVRFLTARLVLDGLVGLYWLVGGKRKLTAAIFNGHMAFYRQLPQVWATRHQVPPRCLNRLGGFYNGWLLWAYYAGRRRTFKQLVPHPRQPAAVRAVADAPAGTSPQA